MNKIAAIFGILLLGTSAYAENVQIISHGIAGLEKRLEMIDHAQQYIDVEYFLYREDQAGRIFTQALIKKKKEIPNIRIRLLVDHSVTNTPFLSDASAAELESLGIEVKFYNTAGIFHPIKTEFRDHRKLLSIDGKEAITGSRNIAMEYFDLNPVFNFRDRDIWTDGAIVGEMEASFEEYWASDWSKEGKNVQPNQASLDLITPNAHDTYLVGEIARVGKPILAIPESFGTCDSPVFVTDVPGKQGKGTRKVLPYILGQMSRLTSGQSLLVESPYFIVKGKEGKDEMTYFKEAGVHATLVTNSLATTDEFLVAANFIPQASFYESISNSEMYVFSGATPKNIDFALDENGVPITKNASWGIHAKSYVFGDNEFAIGTFNMDPRSADLNGEMLYFCDNNPTLTAFVKNDIQATIDESYLLDKNGSIDGGKSYFDGVGPMKKFEFELMRWPSRLLAPLL